MAITRLNHAVLYVRDLQASLDFYCGVMGFSEVMRIPQAGAAFLQADGSDNDHDLGLFQIGGGAAPSNAGRGGGVGLYHLAWEVDTLADMARLRDTLSQAGALSGASDHGTTKSLYGADPDGIEFEVAWIVPAALLDVKALSARTRIDRLDLDAEIARYGATTPGGLGISQPSITL